MMRILAALFVWFGSPVALTKFEFLRPRRAASRFICSTKFSSLPAMPSASAIDASLPDCTIMPCSSSSIATALPGSRNMREPGARQAFSEIVTDCDSVTRFWRKASNAT